MSKIKVLLAIPMLTPGYEFVKALLNFQAEVLQSGRYELGISTTYRQPTFLVQESFAQQAMATGCDYLLMMDDDIWNPSLDFLDKLVSADKDVIGGVFFASADPGNLCARRRIDRKRDLVRLATVESHDVFSMYPVPEDEWHGPQKVDLVSLGMCLIKTSIFRKLKQPWFSHDLTKQFTDSVFCDNCSRNKIEVYAHFDVWLNHRGITKETMPSWVQIYKMRGDNWRPVVKMTEKDIVTHINVVKSRVRVAQKEYEEHKAHNVKFYGKEEAR